MEPRAQEKLARGDALVGVIGLGYVGLPLARAFVDAGLRVRGFDIDPAKPAALKAGRNYLKHLGDEFLAPMSGPRFEATTDFARLGECDAALICVPTPLGAHREPDLSYVVGTAETVARTLRPGQLVVLESTTYPGTTRDVVGPILRRAWDASAPNAWSAADRYYLAFSPEREDPGRPGVRTAEVPKLVGGVDPESGAVAGALYRRAFRQVIEVSGAEVAEAAKLLENIYRSVNIAMVNEMKVLLTALGIDIWEVIAAARTKPFGFQAFYPGPGLGGHCIPIDPYYLTWKAREVGLPTRFIELAGEINHHMPRYVVGRVAEALNHRGRAVNGSKVLVLGLAYKPDIDDVRESPALVIIELLREQGAMVEYNDPQVPATHRMRRHDLQMRSVELTPDLLAEQDAVVIATHHAAYDWELVGRHARLIIDTRGVMRAVKGARAEVVGA